MHRLHAIERFISEEDLDAAVRCIRQAVAAGTTEPYADIPSVLVVPDTDPVGHALLAKYATLLEEAHKATFGFQAPLTTCQAQLCFWPEGSAVPPHVDSHGGFEFVVFSSVVYLNDDFEGGEIFFPNQGVTRKPVRATALLFPSGGLEAPHGVTKVTRGGRYTISMFHGVNAEARWDRRYSKQVDRRVPLARRAIVPVLLGSQLASALAWWTIAHDFAGATSLGSGLALLAVALFAGLFGAAFVVRLTGTLRKKQVALLALAGAIPPAVLALASLLR